VNCKGVIIAIGLSISLDGYFGVTSMIKLFDVSDSESPNPCEGIYAWPWACFPGIPFSGFPSYLWGTLAP
jgi:hypothetical protein